jgi:hypothetical protein
MRVTDPEIVSLPSGIISPVYLLDALVEIGLIALWADGRRRSLQKKQINS